MCPILLHRTGCRAALAAALALSCSCHVLANDSAKRDTGFQSRAAVDETRLAQTRGGFVTPSGLILSLGIERSISINGTMVAQTNLHINDVRAMTSADAAALKNALQPMIVQRGSGNTLPSSVSQLAAGTFVQNSLSDQTISTNTVISSTLNSGSMLKEINFMSSVRDANIGAMSAHH